MKNKLLLGSALVSAVALTSGVNAETKVTGNLEQTWHSVSRDLAAKQIDGASAFGAETNIGLSGSKELDNGLKASYGFVIEHGVDDSHFITVGTDTVAVTVGRDRGDTIDADALPYISDDIATVTGAVGGLLENGTTAHNVNHIDLRANLGVAAVTARYAPSQDAGGKDDGAITSKHSEGSGTEFVIKGNFGVEGLSVLAGMATTQDDTATGEDQDVTKFGASYNFGQVTVGAQRGKVDAGTGANDETTNDTYGVSFSANDNLSVGLYIGNSDKQGSAEDEESKMIQFGYNLGGLGIEIGHMQIENIGYASGDDADITFVRTIQKF